jgi:hypothetical protein
MCRNVQLVILCFDSILSMRDSAWFLNRKRENKMHFLEILKMLLLLLKRDCDFRERSVNEHPHVPWGGDRAAVGRLLPCP